MGSLYKPASGMPRVIRGFTDAKKILVSTHPRVFQSGSFLWINKVATRYQAEPSLLSPVNATADRSSSDSAASSYASLDAVNAVLAPLFLGLAGEGRIAQQNNNFGLGSAAGDTPASVMDASKPFITYYDRGIAEIPVGPTISTNGVLTTAIDPETLVYPDGFANEAGTGFYDPALVLQKDAYWYAYNNCVTTTSTRAYSIGKVVERAEIGSPILIVEFWTNFATVGGV